VKPEASNPYNQESQIGFGIIITRLTPSRLVVSYRLLLH
jgi:hypothetical protein